MKIPEFKTKKELYNFLIENKDVLKAQKKAERKEVDCGIIVTPVLVHDKSKANKADGAPVDTGKLKAVVVINTTNLMDSHLDVHLPGIWDKTLRENKYILHVQEHKSSSFEKIIAEGEDLKSYTKEYTWAELGYDFEGTTEALVFESTVRKERNEFMYRQYLNGWVRNHSVGMYYVKLDMAINDEDYPNEFEAWKKYIGKIANRDKAEDLGYFWYVLEAKLIEGSAVPLGSNFATPTISIDTKDQEPPQGTHGRTKEPPQGTRKAINYDYLLENL